MLDWFCLPPRSPIIRLSLFLLFAAVYLTGLARVGIFQPDEPRYAAIGVAMAHSGDWVTPRLWGDPWFEKSPLLYWQTAAATWLGLGPETAPRLPVALTAFSLLVFLYLFLKQRLDQETALRSAILLAGAAGWLAFSSVGVTDVLLTTHLTISILLIVFGGPPWLAGIFLGLAALAKGLVPFALFIPVLWWMHRSHRLRQLLPLSAFTLLVAAPWYVAVTLKHGRAFFDEFIIKHHFGRFASSELQHGQPPWFYLPILLAFLLPWTGLLPFVWQRLRDPRLRFLGLWVVYSFLFFSIFRNKLPGYILPVLPVCCVLLAAALKDLHWKAGVTLGVTAALLIVAGFPVLMALPQLLAGGWRKSSFDSVGLWTLPPGGAIGLGIWWLDKTGRRTLALAAVSGLLMGALAWVKFGPLAAEIDRLASARSLAGTAPKDGCVHPADRDLRYGLSYYWNFEVPECNDDTIGKRIRKNALR